MGGGFFNQHNGDFCISRDKLNISYSIPDAGVALGGLSVRSIKYLISKGDLQTCP